MLAIAVWFRVQSFEAAAPAEPQQTASLGDAASDVATPVSDAGAPASRDWTIEPYPGGNGEPASATTGTRERARTTREQRYQELLRSTPPPGPADPPPAPPKESLFERVVTPIASALGMRSKPQTAPPPPRAAASQPQRSQAQSQPQNTDPQPRNDERDGRRAEEQDPDTDVTPPTLMAAEFVPAQVRDGEETTFAVMVTDNLSGVRSVSGVVASPSGALQGFACRREGETPRFVARIAVPKDAAEGLWTVKYLTLTDNASNSINLNAAQGALPQSAAFRVISSGSDSSGPQLRAAWIDRIAMRAGERNTMFVEADDDKAGVSLVSGVFVSPNKQARLGFGCRQNGGVWECPVTPPACLDCGLWQLEQIQLQDKANNMATFRADNQIVGAVRLDIAGESCDSAPPAISSLVVNPPVVSNMDGGEVRIEAIVVDDGCGVASLSGQAIPPGGVGGQRAYFSFEPSPDGRTFIGRIPVPKHSAKGVWTIAWIQALDRGHNLRAYSSNDPVISRVTFRVD